MSTPHLALKFPILPTEVGVIHADQKEARRCYHESLKKKWTEVGNEGTHEVHMVETNKHQKMNMMDLDPREEGKEKPSSTISSKKSRLE